LDDVFPTDKLTDVNGTRYHFSAPDGKLIGNELYDDYFSGLVRSNGQVRVDLIDPAARCALHIEGFSPEIKTVQFYAHKDKPVVAIEEQYNFGDPFSGVWKTMSTGMVTLSPGQSTVWRVQLQLFVPGKPGN
jgi:hypothetical protein